jgi:Zn-dependent peptidase ImmA (M78 family)
MTDAASLLDAVFGKDSKGAAPEERATTSSNLFVRSQHQISEFRDGAKGRILNAQEALRAVGWDKLKLLADSPAIPILRRSDEPYRSISLQLDALGVSFAEAARKAHWGPNMILGFEKKEQIPFKELERLARAIGLESDFLGTLTDNRAENETGVRLRTYRSSDPNRFTANTVLSLSEAAWTIQKQFYLAELIGESAEGIAGDLGFEPSDAYGSAQVKTYQEGYRLARRTRELLGVGLDQPIESIKELIESQLRIPVIQLEIHQELAGATVSSGSARGIAVNLNGDNLNPLVRRMTMAHELGHLLWDPDQRLKKLVVDKYDSIIRDAVASASPLDVVERRANAFAIEFLAPGDTILKTFSAAGGGAEGLAKVISTFGVSKTAVANHIMNASFNRIDVSAERIPIQNTDEWEARESLAVPLFNPQTVPVSRRGRFAYYVMRAYDTGLISNDTAASLYQCTVSELQQALSSTRNFVVEDGS